MKAQSSVEFMILIGVMFFFFMGVLFVIYGNISDKNKANLDTLIVDLASSVKNEISIASTAGDGYTRSFNIPGLLIGNEYSISINASSIYVRTNDGKHAVALPVANVTGQIMKGDNVIKNVNGTVFLN